MLLLAAVSDLLRRSFVDDANGAGWRKINPEILDNKAMRSF